MNYRLITRILNELHELPMNYMYHRWITCILDELHDFPINYNYVWITMVIQWISRIIIKTLRPVYRFHQRFALRLFKWKIFPTIILRIILKNIHSIKYVKIINLHCEWRWKTSEYINKFTLTQNMILMKKNQNTHYLWTEGTLSELTSTFSWLMWCREGSETADGVVKPAAKKRK